MLQLLYPFKLLKNKNPQEKLEKEIRKVLTQVVTNYLKTKYPIKKFELRDMLEPYYIWDGGAILKQPDKWLNVYIDMEKNFINIRIWDDAEEDYVKEYTFYDIDYSPVLKLISQ